ncbi:MAG: tyrosine-type recombinase/integrase, partial [Rhodospirillaceae bacterium]
MVHAEHAPGWKNSKHAAQWFSTLETYAFPKLGNLPVNQIDGPMVRDVLADIWLVIPETARRVRQRIGTVLDFAHAKGWREAEAPMRSVTRGLPKQPKRKQHLAAMAWQNVPAFVASMSDTLQVGEPVRLALEFLILTAARSGEVRGARWSEIDFSSETWTVPASRMKGGREHRVPLSSRAIEILRRMHQLRRTDHPDALVFEGRKPGKLMSDMTLTMALKRADLPVTVHGFRSAFR